MPEVGRELVRSVANLGWNVSVNQAGPLLEQMLAVGHVALERVDEPNRLPFIVRWTITTPTEDCDQGDYSAAAGNSLFEACLHAIDGLRIRKP